MTNIFEFDIVVWRMHFNEKHNLVYLKVVSINLKWNEMNFIYLIYIQSDRQAALTAGQGVWASLKGR